MWHLKAAMPYIRSNAINTLGYIARVSLIVPKLAVRGRFLILPNPVGWVEWDMIVPPGWFIQQMHMVQA